MPGGRPSTYSDEMAETICQEIAEGKSLTAICSERERPSYRAVMQWLHNWPEFAQKYARAREAQADYYADEMVEIADTTSDPNKARLQIDARKWKASKLAPKKYGEKLELEHSGAIRMLTDEELDARIAQLLDEGRVGRAIGGAGAQEADAEAIHLLP